MYNVCSAQKRAHALKFGETILTLVNVKEQLPWKPRDKAHGQYRLKMSFISRCEKTYINLRNGQLLKHETYRLAAKAVQKHQEAEFWIRGKRGCSCKPLSSQNPKSF